MEEAAALERLDPLTRGSLFHDVQKRFFEAFEGRPVDPVSFNAAVEVLDTVLRETAAEYAERLAPAIPQIWENEVERLRADLRGQLAAVAYEDSSWISTEAERAFDNVTVGEGWRVRGRMDLIEQNGNGGTRITDYKTGSFPDPAPQVTGGGEMLQPLLYAMAAERIYRDRTVTNGRLFYATLRGGLTVHSGPLSTTKRDQATKSDTGGRLECTAKLCGRRPGIRFG
jgi:RecB family exonuclease